MGGNRVERQISGTLKRVEVHVTDQGCDSLASREAPVGCAPATAPTCCRPVQQSETLMDLLCSRLLNFRLLEAAGICDSVAASPNLGPVRSSKWWRLLATVLRNYRSALSSEAPATISEFVLGVAWCDGAETEDIAGEISRIVHEFRRWQTEVPGGEAYIAFVQGYAGFAELDGKRGPMHLARALQITEQSFPLTNYLRRCVLLLNADPRARLCLEGPICSYEAFQATADYLQKVFNLPTHPLEDIAQFAILPAGVAVKAAPAEGILKSVNNCDGRGGAT